MYVIVDRVNDDAIAIHTKNFPKIVKMCPNEKNKKSPYKKWIGRRMKM